MKKIRVIPVIILRNGEIVQSYNFERYKVIGNALKAVERFSQWDADEMIYIDITPQSSKSGARQDLNSTKVSTRAELIEQISKRSSMPLTFGGGLRTLQDIENAIYFGADKVSINTLMHENISVVKQAVNVMGSQAIVASIDYDVVDNRKLVWNPAKRSVLDLDVIEWAKEVEQLGVGEILLTCINRDGSRSGYDLETIEEVSDTIKLPIIANSGAGEWDHLRQAVSVGADAVAAANIFHFYDQSVYQARKFLFNSGVSVRRPSLEKSW